MAPPDRPRFAFEMLQPTWGRLLVNIGASAVGLFVVVLVHGWLWDTAPPLAGYPRLFAMLLALSAVLWIAATAIRSLFRNSPD